MKRSEFINALGLGASGLVLPKQLLAQQPIKIYDNYVKGLIHYQYDTVAKQLQIGASLTLQRDVNNVYDAFAVEVYFGAFKLGYLPAYENIVIANILDTKVRLTAKTSAIREDDHPHKLETLGVEVYADVILPTPQLLTELQNNRADDVVDIYRKGYNI